MMTSFALKMIAVITMTLHHLEMCITQPELMRIFPSLSMKQSAWIEYILVAVSRMAFPLFAFMIAEGCRKTRSMPKYIGRLALFAIISEPFFYFAKNVARFEVTPAGFLENLSRKNFNNVFFTLALGVVCIYLYQYLERIIAEKRLSQKYLLLFLPIAAVIGLFSGYIHASYGLMGVILIVALYFAKTKPHTVAIITIWSVLLYVVSYGKHISVTYILNCLFAVLACLPIWFYNGKRGLPLKWSFYLYYPIHLLLCGLIGLAL